MKKIISVSAVILSMFILIAAAPNPSDSDSVPVYIGTWELNSEKNNQTIDDMYMLFGSSLRSFGAQLNIRADGTIDYYIGLTGGRGIYTVSGDRITAEVRDYAEGRIHKVIFDIVEAKDKTCIIYRYNDGFYSADIWWTKK